MPDFTVSFEVYCDRCGAGLCNSSSTDDRRKNLSVEPCKNCLETARNEGYEKGYDEGRYDGYEKGRGESDAL